MVLADTSVWIQHFRGEQYDLAHYLSEGLIVMHPFVKDELACGTLRNRAKILAYFHALPQATPVSGAEALGLIEDRRLWGRGLGLIDVHLLASALISGCGFWTLDARLALAANDLGVSWTP